jgi:hypothetical protein
MNVIRLSGRHLDAFELRQYISAIMIIFEPRTRTSDRGTIEVRARVESRVPPRDGSSELVFEYALPSLDWITPRADGFVAALVLRAMTVGEDIEVRAPISARLARGLEEYQRVLISWYGYRLTPVRIHAPLEPAAPVPGGSVLTAFSGGVDSFYTLRAHVAGQEPDERARITHGLFVHGFDLSLSNVAAYEGARAGIVETLAGLGIDLIVGRSNVQSFLPRRDWGLFHGGPLLGSALALGGGVRRFYVPASHTIGDLSPWGSSPRLDPLLSTEALEIVHDGADATRAQKTAAIGDWPPTFGRLRVCGSLPNCCRCEKCVRTMITLDLLGLLGRQTSFPLPLGRSHIRACRYRHGGDLFIPRGLIRAAVARRRWDLALDVTIAMVSSIPALARRTVRSGSLRLRAAVPILRPRPGSYLS